MHDEELALVARYVVSSPFRTRDLHGGRRSLSRLVAAPPALGDMLDPRILGDIARLASDLSGESIVWRDHSVCAGWHVYPDVAKVRRLLAIARRELAREPVPMQAGWVGAAVLMIHPFRDGNGRVSRLSWLLALAKLGLSVAAACRTIGQFYADGGNAAMQAWEAMADGDPSRFISRWTESLEAHGNPAACACTWRGDRMLSAPA